MSIYKCKLYDSFTFTVKRFKYVVFHYFFIEILGNNDSLPCCCRGYNNGVNYICSIALVLFVFFFFFFFYLSWFPFTDMQESQGLQGKRECISLTPHYHLYPLHRLLDNSRGLLQKVHLCT